nr:phage tail sheath C-terminal domain-containing protein [Roseburia inulinivorans]
MALGGGTYLTQNKVLPGAYFQFISKAIASATLSDRGVAAMALELDWGADDKVIGVTASDFMKDSKKIFGFDYDAAEMLSLRELFKHASKVYVYKVTSGGVKASNTFAEAKYTGKKGNDLKVVIQTNVDDGEKFDVLLYLGTEKMDSQTVSKASELIDNDFVVWKKSAELSVTAATALSGGTNGTASTSNHQAFLDKISSYPDVNAIGYAGSESAVKGLYAAFADRLRNDVGIRLQVVMHDYSSADSISCVNVKNSAELVYWATGVIAGTAVNKSATNMKYDGELSINTEFTQDELTEALGKGEWVLHQVGTEVHVLEDINSFTSITDEMGDIFKDNQTIRVIDTRADSIASIFASKYLGKVPNDKSGRVSLWSDIVKIDQQLSDINAIEDFDPEDITVEQGDTKKSVLINSAITIINTMEKVYMKSMIE